MERAICIEKGGQNMSVPRWEPQTKLGLYRTEKETESEAWARIKGE